MQVVYLWQKVREMEIQEEGEPGLAIMGEHGGCDCGMKMPVLDC